ncbi:PREDICTED: LOC109949918 [Prunus dulcis]|uniref:PREDICTED: LOC109949918 n=1 Tax=Prunus dulcis TaxID=3755 RepID=A0A5E4G381_PRUDU|nr:PREDICTED: LOC109949918 [Prunus dulcis]
MSKKPDSKPAYGYCGYLEVMPLSKGSSSSQLKDRYSYKDAYGGGCSSSFIGSYKAGEFVDKSTGGLGY